MYCITMQRPDPKSQQTMGPTKTMYKLQPNHSKTTALERTATEASGGEGA